MSFLLSFLILGGVFGEQYQPTWDSIDSRPLPDWYDEAKFGIFMHWGAYSVPAYRSEWFWWYWQGTNETDCNQFMINNYPPDYTYADFARNFKAEFFDPDEFREIVEASGARYFVFTSKHHEGFTMWPSKASWNWNSVDLGPKLDVVGALKKAFTKSEVHFGLYFSLFEWFHPLFQQDLQMNTSQYVEKVSYPQLLDLVKTYEPDIVWSDGDWGQSDAYWMSKEFLAWLYNDSPVKDKVVTNDRWGDGIMGKHGGFLTYEDNYQPETLLERKWENCDSMDQYSWGNRRTMRSSEILTTHDALAELAQTIACNGNFLLNIGPDRYGKIPSIFEDRLREIGQFLKANSEAVYGTRPWVHQNDTNNVWYTSRLRDQNLPKNRAFNPQDEQKTIIYAWIVDVNLTEYQLENIWIGDKTKASILSSGTPLEISSGSKGQLVVSLSRIPWQSMIRRDVLVLKIEYAADSSKKKDSSAGLTEYFIPFMISISIFTWSNHE